MEFHWKISKEAAVVLGFASQGKVSLEPSALKSHLTELEGGQNGFCPNAFERSENLYHGLKVGHTKQLIDFSKRESLVAALDCYIFP